MGRIDRIVKDFGNGETKLVVAQTCSTCRLSKEELVMVAPHCSGLVPKCKEGHEVVYPPKECSHYVMNLRTKIAEFLRLF